MNWIYYLLEANFYLAAFYLMYKLFLQNSTFYNGNRYFLLGSVAVAFIFPLLQLGFLKPQVFATPEVFYQELPIATFEVKTIEKSPLLTIEDYLFYGYLVLAVCFALKFILSVTRIAKIYFDNRKQKFAEYTLVELPTEQSAFSFFNLLFIHPNFAKNEAVLIHEQIHIKEKHSIDILLLELLKIICWFNPVIYLIKNDLRLLHEYIADENTTVTTVSKHRYAMFLIENSIGAFSPSLVNQFFNQSILKKRITMLNKEKTASWARLNYLLAVPLGLGLLCMSTLTFSKTYGYLEIMPQQVQQKKAAKVKQDKPVYYPEYRYDKHNNFISLEQRAIIVNGKLVADKNKYYGVAEADEIKYLNSNEATKKYGSKIGKNGVVEITGKNLLATPPPPMMPSPPDLSKVKKDQIKFPAPVIKPQNQTSFYPKNVYESEKAIKVDPRLIVINGETIVDNSTFYGVRNTEEVIFIHPNDAAIKYGEKGKNGAVEISGPKAQKMPLTPSPPIEQPPLLPKPPKVKKDEVRFPPLIVKPDKKTSSTNSAKLLKEIEVAQLASIKNEKPKVIEVVPTKKTEELEITKVNQSRLELKPADKIERLEIKEVKPSARPSKKVQEIKPTPTISQNKTVALKTTKNQSNNKQKVIAPNVVIEKTNNAFTKAWTIYKPKVQENSSDGC